MIVSFENKFIFVAVPKTASQAIRSALRIIIAESDWEQCAYKEQRRIPIGPVSAIGHGHIAFSEILPFLLPGMKKEFFSFGFVRNPYDRFVSACTYFEKIQSAPEGGRCEIMKRVILGCENSDHEVHFRPQHTFLTDAKGEIVVSFVGRYENLLKDFSNVCAEIGKQGPALDRINTSERETMAEYFDQELIEMICDHYRVDFQLFGYDKALPEYV